MADPARIENRVSELERTMSAVVENLVRAPLYQRSWEELVRARALANLSEYDLEACICVQAEGAFDGIDDPRLGVAEGAAAEKGQEDPAVTGTGGLQNGGGECCLVGAFEDEAAAASAAFRPVFETCRALRCRSSLAML